MWRADSRQTIAGGMTGMGIHQVDLMILFVGKMVRVHAKAKRQLLELAVDDNITALIDFENGATGVLSTLTTTSSIWRLRILGSSGWIEMIGENRLLISEGNTLHEITFPSTSTERIELEAFVRAISGDDIYPICAEDVLHGVSVLEAVAASGKDCRMIEVAA